MIRKGEIILVEDKRTLMRKLGQRQLTVHLQQPLAALPAALATFPLALSDDGTTLVYTFDAQEEGGGIADLLRALDAAGVAFRDLQTSESSLEDIFVQLVKEPA